MRSDVVIIGGGIIGSAAAYFLTENDRSIDVTVIEPDPTYEKSSTPAGAGGVRRLMARPENIQMSQFSLDFYADFQEIMATEAFSADIQFRRQGYLFDGNMIIGPYSNGHENILTACGFSGHGIMHAPAVGRALSELVIHGSFQTIDLSRMSFDRVPKGSPYAEIGIK